MSTTINYRKLGVTALVFWLLFSSCGLFNTTRVGDTRTDTQNVELGSANEAKVRIEMGAGQLTVTGGAQALMEGTFRYNVTDWQPRLDYSVNDGQGVLVIDQSGIDIPFREDLVIEWNLSLNNLVPINLEIQTGAGETELDLRDLNLTALQVNIDAGIAGVTTLDLSSALDHDLNATVSVGVGDLTVKLPGEMGVRVSGDTAVGGLTNSGLVKDGEYYVNDAYGSAPNTLFLDISTSVGSINLLAP
jgi:hypothetical protein